MKDNVDRTNALAVTSWDSEEWNEIPEDESARHGLTRTLDPKDPVKNAEILRKLFPLKARLRKTDHMIHMPEGTILKYARVRREPTRYPIEVFFTTKASSDGSVMTRKMSMDSSEVELLEP